MKVKGNMQGSAQAGIQTQSGQLVDGQGLAEQLEGQDIPAALVKGHRTAQVHHLRARGQQRQCQIQSPPQVDEDNVCCNHNRIKLL